MKSKHFLVVVLIATMLMAWFYITGFTAQEFLAVYGELVVIIILPVVLTAILVVLLPKKVVESYLFGVVATLLLAYLIVPATLISFRLTEAKVHFYKVATANTPAIVWSVNENGDPDNKLDYAGKLTTVIQDRDRLLKKHGFVAVGMWMARDGGDVVIATTYVYVGKNVATNVASSL